MDNVSISTTGSKTESDNLENYSVESHKVECLIHNNPAAIERVLRVIRVRGFTMLEMNITIIDGRYFARFILTGHRAIENLIAQLQKLIDVVEAGCASED